MKSILLFLFLFYSITSTCQGISPERIAKLKSATVKILAGQKMGTGFYVDDKGTVATCWHVVVDALKSNIPISILNSSGQNISMVVPIRLIDSVEYPKAVSYDYFILIPKTPLSAPTPFLRLGNYSDASEGQEIYTCGYPLNSDYQFVSRGIISTKYIQEDNYVQTGEKITKVPRLEAILDLTLNQGNSGGAIIKIGKTLSDDVVIGIADFVVNPLGNTADSMIGNAKVNQGLTTFGSIDAQGKIVGVDPSATVVVLGEALKTMSIGISGCISVDYLYECLKSLQLLKYKKK